MGYIGALTWLCPKPQRIYAKLCLAHRGIYTELRPALRWVYARLCLALRGIYTGLHPVPQPHMGLCPIPRLEPFLRKRF